MGKRAPAGKVGSVVRANSTRRDLRAVLLFSMLLVELGKAGLAWQQGVPVLCCAAAPLDDSELHLLLGKIVSTLGGVAAIELIVGLQLLLHLMEGGGGGGGVHKA